jgi:hypothetical protein
VYQAAAGEGLQLPPRALRLDFIDDALWQARGSGVKAVVEKTVVVVRGRAVVRRPVVVRSRVALTGFVVDLCGSISTDRCAARGCLLWCSNLSDASTWAASGAPLPVAALVGHEFPAASAVAG